MKKLLVEIIRNLILEYTPQEGVTLYHRSFHKFKVGDVIKPKVDPSTGKPHRSDRNVEKALEIYRSKKHPELPSRFNCVYLSYLPRSRFLSKGNLYAVKLGPGPTLTTDSMIIDELANRYRSVYDYNSSKFLEPYVYDDDDLIVKYWEGVDPTRDNLHNLEVLASSATVIEVIDDKNMHPGDVIELGRDAEQIQFMIDVYITNGAKHTYASDGGTMVPLSTIEKKINAFDFHNVKFMKAPDSDYQYGNFVVTFNRGTKLKVVSTRLKPEPTGKLNPNAYIRMRFALLDDPDVSFELTGSESLKLLRSVHKSVTKVIKQ